MTTEPYDLVGVGLGPFNLSLAALADPLPLRAAFLDAKPAFSWHPGMLIPGTTLQVSFLADLVTLADPASRWSFLSYLRDRGRLFPFYFAERFHVSRREYDAYCRWVADALPSCRFGAPVEAVRWAGDRFALTVGGDDPGELHARDVVLGVGTEPVVPDALRCLTAGPDPLALHSSAYLAHAEALRDAGDVTVVGSGQSGAEVFLDLLQAPWRPGRRLRWLTRSAFAPMEYSKLGLEHFTPDYTAYFRGLPEDVRDALVPDQWQLYQAIDADTIAAIHDALYERQVEGAPGEVVLQAGVDVVAAARDAGGAVLSCHELRQDRVFEVGTGRVVAATGYEARPPACLDPLRDLVTWDARGRYRIDGDHRVALDPAVTGRLYVQNAELHTHGVGTPDLGLGAYRAATILNAVTGRPAYPLPDRVAYQTFGAPRPA